MQDTTLNTLKTGKNIFLTGSAGTGKTFILNEYILYLKQRKIIPTVVAPTGIAASHLNGQTIHSFFSLGIRSGVDEQFVQSLVDKKYLQPRFKKLKVLIIDEISMVSPEVFSSMNMILQAFKQNRAPFGGVQVILSGDFFQLPPISRVKTDKRFAWQAQSWKELDLKTCYLEKKFRQDDNQLISVLDEIRSGEISQSTYDILNSRYEKELDMSFQPTNLYTHNMDVDRINNEELEKLESKAHTFDYTSTGTKPNVEKLFKSNLVSQELILKKDAVVMFIKNNHEKGYINGTTGVVIDFDRYTSLPIVKISNGHIIKVEKEDWAMENESGKVLAKILQIPLKLAWAITIHKSQGMTLDSAQIDLTKTFEVGQGYVALSRIRNIEGLKLMGFNDIALSVDPLILKIDPRIKLASKKTKDEISAYTAVELVALHLDSIRKLGGITDVNKIKEQEIRLKEDKEYDVTPSIATHLKTKELLSTKESIEDIAKARDMSITTILKHLTILKEEDPDINLDKFKPDENTVKLVEDVVATLKQKNDKDDFSENGELRLKPIFIALNEKVSYDDIKRALI